MDELTAFKITTVVLAFTSCVLFIAMAKAVNYYNRLSRKYHKLLEEVKKDG